MTNRRQCHPSSDNDREAGIADLEPLSVVAPLRAAAKLLLARPSDHLGRVDLSNVVVATLTPRWGRQLLANLEEEARFSRARVVPPIVTSPLELHAHLGVARGRVADETTTLAAIETSLRAAIKTAPPSDHEAPPDLHRWLPVDDDVLEVHALARRLHDADRAIRSAGRSWAEVASAVLSRGGDDERYVAAERVLDDARRRLADEELVTREDAIDAVIEALVESSQTDTDQAITATTPSITEIVLIGTVDLTLRDRRLLEAAGIAGCLIRPFVLAPHAQLDRFGRLGELDVSAWTSNPPVVPLTKILIEDRPLDAAIALADWIAERQQEKDEGVLDPREIAVVLADESMGGTIRREIEARGARLQLGSERPAFASGLARTLERLAAWEQTPDSITLGGLLADPAIGAAVEATRVVHEGDREEVRPPSASATIPPLDRTPDSWADWKAWATEQPSQSIASLLLDSADDGSSDLTQKHRRRMRSTVMAIRSLQGLAEDEEPSDSKKIAPLSTMITRVLGTLARITEAAGDASPWCVASMQAVREVADAIRGVPASLEDSVTAQDAIRFLLECLRTKSISDHDATEAIETIGWLDAPFEPAGRIAVLGLHETAVPGTPEDPWLPDTLRSDLGIEHAGDRTARDAWILSVLLDRDPAATFVLPRHDALGNELPPSRLLFGDRGKDLAHRVQHIFQPVEPRREAEAVTSSFGRMEPPEPNGSHEYWRNTMSVAEFRDYLRSPYRYWLRYILRLDAEPTAGRELDECHFGDVLHAAIEEFGRREITRSRDDRAPLSDVDDIHAEMRSAMRETLHRITSGTATAGLRIQERILDQRLRRAAEIQSVRAEQGWRVHSVKWSIDHELELPGDKPQRISGCIDRIDHHDEHGWMLLDFRTSDTSKQPDSAHRLRDGFWLDLKLPLYRWAAAQHPEAPGLEDIRTGYFLVGGRLDQIGIASSMEIDSLPDEAMEITQEVVRSVRAGYFSDIGVAVPDADDPLALLMRTPLLPSGAEA